MMIRILVALALLVTANCTALKSVAARKAVAVTVFAGCNAGDLRADKGRR